MKYIKHFVIGIIILLLISGGTVFVIITFYKKELSSLFIDNLKTTYGLTLNVKDIRVSFFDNWPHASVKLKDVFIASSLNGNTDPILKAGSLSLSFNLQKMLKKEFIVKYVSLNDAEVFMVKHANGTKNFEFKKQTTDTAKHSAISFGLNKVSLKNVKFQFSNIERGQNISISFADVDIRLKQYTDGLKATITGNTLINQLLFNPKKGAFLKNTRANLNLHVNYLYETKTICVYPPSFAEIENHPYALTSLITISEDKRLALQIEGKKVKFERVITLLNPKMQKMLRNFEVKRPIDAKVLLVVNIGKREEPVIIADILGENCDLAIGHSKIPYSELFFKGKIISLDSTKQKGDAECATVIFEPIRGKVYDFPFTASVSIVNLVEPFIDIKADLLIEANKIPLEVSKDFILKGSATAKLNYSGPTSKLNKKEFLQSPMNLSATLTFKNLSYKELERPYVYVINGKSQLNNRNLQFDNLNVNTNIANANVKGMVEGFVPYLFGFSKRFKATLSASTDLLQLDPLFAANQSDKKPSDNQAKNTSEKMSQSQFEFVVNLFAKKLLFRKVVANDAKVALHYIDNALDLNSLAVNTCDGHIKGRANVRNFNRLNADVVVENVNVNKLFTQFENFGQEAVVDENLKGNIFIEANFSTDLDERLNLKPETMIGDVKLKLVNGHLINFEPVQNLSNFLFKNRDFNEVTFSELNEKFKLRGYQMEIEELEIASNVLNLYVLDGLYDFKGKSNINILVPWSNLKRRGKNYVPKSSGQSAENTKGLKLNYSGVSKKMKISLGHK